MTVDDLAASASSTYPGWTAGCCRRPVRRSRTVRRIVAEVGDWEVLLEMIAAGAGIGFTPVGLQYKVLTDPDSPLRHLRVDVPRWIATST